MIQKQDLTLPLCLTLIRLLVAPLVLPVIFVYLLPYNSQMINAVLATLFALIALTDFLDGYLARRYHQETVIGTLLDPIADKCMVYATLLALVATHKIFFYWAILIIGREFFVTGLRLIAAEHRFSLSVAIIGKVKTVIQSVCLTWIIANPYQAYGFAGAPWWNGIEQVLIVVSVLLSCVSGLIYYQRFVHQWNKTMMP